MQQQQQQQQQMFPGAPSLPPTNITTEQIQKFLEENKKLILAILDNQNLGKLSECAQYQAQLQRNLMYLAAIADSQPPTPTMPPQVAPPRPGMQQSPYFMQHPLATTMGQQQGFQAPNMPLQFGTPHQIQGPQAQQSLNQHQAIQAQMGMRPVGLHPFSAESLAPPPSQVSSDSRNPDGPDGEHS